MKLFVRVLFLTTWLLAGIFLNGCASTDDTQTNQLPARPEPIATFTIGETVVVSFSGLPSGDQLAAQPHEVQVKVDGTISLPYIDPVIATNKTFGQLQDEIHDLYVPKYYPNLTVTVKSGEDRVYYVGGEIKGGGTGRQLYVDGTTVTKAIQSAGGLSDFANHHNIKLIRASTGQVITVDYDKALENPADDPHVDPNDQVNVSRRIW